MLASNSPMTPRPRPPAQVRRSLSLQARLRSLASPPSYQINESKSHTLLGSSISATSHLMHLSELPQQPHPTPEVEEWINERSREELSELLLKANSIIRQRESELSLTSAACKSLIEDNVALQSEDSANLENLYPTSRPHSPSLPRSSSPDHSIGTKSVTWSPRDSPLRKRHTRRESTVSELGVLADQNAELLSKLQDLEADAALSDLEGKRKLRSLEREIRGLRDELDTARERSEHLEQEMKRPSSLASAVLGTDLLKLRKRLDREAKVRALRTRTRPWDGIASEGPRDFAPGDFNSALAQLARPEQSLILSPLLQPPQSSGESETCLPNFSQPLTVNQSSSLPSALEYTLVSQLLAKIRELEETNDQIAAQRRETGSQFRHVEREAAGVRRVYERAGGKLRAVTNDASMIDEADSDPNGDKASRNTRRHSLGSRSLRLDGFEEGINDQMHSTMRDRSSCGVEELRGGTEDWKLTNFSRSSGHKIRKSILGLFKDSEVASNALRPRVSSRSIGHSQSLSLNDLVDRSAESNRPFIDRRTARHMLGSELNDESDERQEYSTHVLSPSIHELVYNAHNKATPISQSTASSAMSTVQSDKLRVHTNHPAENPSFTSSDSIHPFRPVSYNISISSSSISRADGSVEQSMSERTHTTITPRSNVAPLPTTLGFATSRSPSVRLQNEVDMSADDTAAAVQHPLEQDEYATMHQSTFGIPYFIMELWLWLQFAVVIAVFVYAMARRGPKSVLRPGNVH